MRRPFTVDVARTLPAKPGRADPAPQCAGTDHDALCVQMCGQQWHGPGVGVIAEPAWVAREQLTELVVRQGRRHALCANDDETPAPFEFRLGHRRPTSWLSLRWHSSRSAAGT